MGDPRGSWLHLGRCTENYCGFAAFIFGSEIKNSDEGSKGESAVSLLVAVLKTSVALLHLAFASEINKDSRAYDITNKKPLRGFFIGGPTRTRTSDQGIMSPLL